MQYLNLPTIIVEHSISLQNQDYKELSKYVRNNHKAVLVIKAFNDNLIQSSLSTFNLNEKKCTISIKASRSNNIPELKEIEQKIKNLLF